LLSHWLLKYLLLFFMELSSSLIKSHLHHKVFRAYQPSVTHV
jgi:hypothetical protein